MDLWWLFTGGMCLAVGAMIGTQIVSWTTVQARNSDAAELKARKLFNLNRIMNFSNLVGSVLVLGGAAISLRLAGNDFALCLVLVLGVILIVSNLVNRSQIKKLNNESAMKSGLVTVRRKR
ncbi:hypothetical protein ACFY5D_03560 [Paeniglutamicibacter sp. NPDC012692]|uniref:hypothetical protein n=1 Tax=Paeniglutamicibacter sp. NPDC012692 TaxID=3364388 RepID=UPI0036AF7F05